MEFPTFLSINFSIYKVTKAIRNLRIIENLDQMEIHRKLQLTSRESTFFLVDMEHLPKLILY